MSLASRQLGMWEIWTESPIQPCCYFPLGRHYLVLCDLVLRSIRAGFQRDDWLDGMDNRNLYLDVHWYPRRLGRVHYCALFLEIRQHETGQTRWQTGFQRRNLLHNAVRRRDRSRSVLLRSRYVPVLDLINLFNLSKTLGRKPRCTLKEERATSILVSVVPIAASDNFIIFNLFFQMGLIW